MKIEKRVYQVEYRGRVFPLTIFTARDAKARVKVKILTTRKK